MIDAANSFGGTIGRLLVLQEAYPQLKSNENFLKLQDEVVGTENRIATARKDYNDGVQDYNTTRARVSHRHLRQAVWLQRRALLQSRGRRNSSSAHRFKLASESEYGDFKVGA